MTYSVICSVMNRGNRVNRCIDSWLKWDQIGDILLVDWSSKTPVSYNTDDSRFKLHRVNDEQYFSLSKSYNIAIDLCKHNTIVKIDIDYILKSPDKMTELLSKYNFDRQFLHGGGHGVEYMGFCIFNKSHGITYNEQMQGYGFDDQDLYIRLQKRGVKKQKKINNLLEIIHHIPHDNKLRAMNYKEKSIGISTKQNKRISNE